jgi:hypothetical protein
MCHYHPSEESKQKLKWLCEQLVLEVKRLNSFGDPLGCEIEDMHELIDHLYDPSKCKEAHSQD